MAEQTVIALGFFDGVHIGHGALLRQTAARAQELGATSAAFTFDRSPRAFVTGERVPLLTSAAERAALMRDEYGVARVIVAPFDRAMMATPWRAFLAALVGEYGAVWLVAGHDYRFGSKNEGTPDLLRDWCAANGVGCDVIPAVARGGVTVSSTHIRALLERGDVAGAAAFLGRPYALAGEVLHGRRLGTTALLPTANLAPEPWRVLPKRGVYATRATLPDGSVRAAVTNVGVRPTVGGGAVTVETHLPEWEGDLYGATLRVAFLRFLRDERRFATVAALRAQLARDVAASATAEV